MSIDGARGSGLSTLPTLFDLILTSTFDPYGGQIQARRLLDWLRMAKSWPTFVQLQSLWSKHYPTPSFFFNGTPTLKYPPHILFKFVKSAQKDSQWWNAHRPLSHPTNGSRFCNSDMQESRLWFYKLPPPFPLDFKGLGSPFHLILSTVFYTLCCGHTKLLELLHWAEPVHNVWPLQPQHSLSASNLLPFLPCLLVHPSDAQDLAQRSHPLCWNPRKRPRVKEVSWSLEKARHPQERSLINMLLSAQRNWCRTSKLQNYKVSVWSH